MAKKNVAKLSAITGCAESDILSTLHNFMTVSKAMITDFGVVSTLDITPRTEAQIVIYGHITGFFNIVEGDKVKVAAGNK